MNNKVVLKKRIPIIIPLFNAVEYTKQAVETLKRNTHANLYEVIFVDNGSTDGTKDFLKQLIQDDPEHFRVVTNETNLGFAGGMNTGLRAIATLDWEYVTLANNDLLFSQNWLYQLLECMQFSNIPNLGAVGPVSNAAGGTQGVAVGYKTIGEFDKWAQEWHQVHQRQWVPAARLVGLCLLMTRKFVDTVGEFDERFVGGMWEDNELCVAHDTPIPLVDGSTKTIKELSELSSLDNVYVYSINEKGKIIPGKVNQVWKTGTKETLKITLDNNESFRCTSDHKVMLRDGSYVEAKNLKPNDSLMPLYRKFDQAHLPGYEFMYFPGEDKWHFTHREFWKHYNNETKYVNTKTHVVHHKDFTKINNLPTNLVKMTGDDHLRLHGSLGVPPEQIIKRDEGRKRFLESANGKKLTEWRRTFAAQLAKDSARRKKVSDKMKGRKFSEEHRQNILAGQKEARANGAYAESDHMLSERQIAKYSDPKNRALQSELSKKTLAEFWNGSKAEETRELISIKVKAALAKRTPEQILETSKKKSISAKAARAKLTPEERSAIVLRGVEKTKEKNALRTVEERQIISKRILEAVKKAKALLTPEERSAAGKKGAETRNKLKSLATPILNHKVIQVEVFGVEDVYDMEVETYHNFAVGFSDKSGVFVHNCLRGFLAGFRYAVDQSTLLHHYMNKTFQTNKMDASGLFHSNRKRYVDKWAAADSGFEEMAKANFDARVKDAEVAKKDVPIEQRLPDGRLKKFVVAACRVKDGARYLPRVLERISTFADEIVVSVSKLTTDNTKEICAQFSKVVLIGDDKDDVKGYAEADSRNMVLDMAYSRHPDWIWLFDHDEMPTSSITTEIEYLTNPENPEVMLWTFPIVQLWNSDNTRRIDGLWGKFWQGRMFRALPGLRIEGTGSLIHVGSHPTFQSEHWGTSLVKILHYGNVRPEDRVGKYARYTKIDTEKNLDMVLGQWKEYYWKLYYGDPTPNEVAQFKASGIPWQTIADPADWSRPAYGTIFARDAYRHVNDETGAKFVPFDETHKISLCMLIHNEGEMIARCLEGVRDHIDEIICVDTGCTDNTPNFARQMGARVVPFKWTDNFSDARNFSLSLATGDWIFRLDPDEQLPPESLPHLSLMVREPGVEGWIFPIINWLEHPGSVKEAQWALSETCRLFKNQYPTVKYAGIVHEELDDSFIALRKEREAKFLADGGDAEIAKTKSFMDIRRAPCQLWHFGYLRGQTVLDNKFKYYYALGNKQIEERPNDPRAWFTTGVHALHVGDYEEAINRYKKVLELNPKDHMAMNDCGVLLWSCGRYDQAEKHFQHALSLMGSDVHDNHKQRVEKNLQTVRRTVLSMMLFR